MKKIHTLFLIVMMFCSGGSAFNNLSAQWVQGTGFDNNTVMCMTSIGSNLIAGSSISILTSGKIYKSTNNGASWFDVSTNIAGLSGVFSLAVKDGLVFAGTYEDGLFVSADSGSTWSVVPVNSDPHTGVFKLGVSGSKLTAYANTQSAYYVTTNNGANWSTVSYNGGVIGSFYNDASGFYSTSSQGLYKSSNNGLTWQHAANNGLLANPDGTKRLVALTSIGNKLFTSTSYPDFSVYYSTNSGDDWVNTNLNFPQNTQVSSFAVSGVKLYAGVKRSVGNPQYGVWYTSNDGASWQEANTGLPFGVSVFDIMIKDNNIFACTQGQGVWRADLSTLTSLSPTGSNTIPVNLNLYQNFPNPFNPSTKIKFDIPANVILSGAKNPFVKLTIYNSLGKTVSVLVNKNLQPGSYEYTFDAGGFPSEVYFYTLNAGSFTSTKTMLLLK